MGVPLPFVLNLAKVRMAPAAAGLLFGINAAASALAVPLCLNISAACGFHKVFEVGMILYALVGLLVVALHRPVLQWMSCAVSAAVVALVLAAPWLLVRSPPPAGLGGPDAHRLYALEYGVSNRAESQILEGGSSRQRPFAWYFFAARGGGRTVLIDTGFDDRAAARDWRIREYRSPVTRLRELGIAPLDVTDIVLTHAHWDHMGALAEYRNATIWMQEAEFHHAVAAVSPSVEEDSGVRWKDVRELLAADREGRLRLLQGEQEVIPGITVTPGGAHTPGFQYVTVRTLDGDVVVAGDASCMHQNSQWHIPISSCSDTAANLEAIRQMHVRAASPFFIIPGHDPFVLAQFPEVAPGITQITAVPESHP
jgi:glyoxylase-like metal-dependent hydrolase (beta-lactamase superfamily II)